MELRCEWKLHGVLEDGIVEVKCNSSRCGASRETVVLHRFDITTGNLVETLRFRNPRSTECP